ncbi:hypothetical protein K502DRAFT_200165 [Neoconidiobolus thromboides FSU 785]|nr:hypothetical protein K502DRAFT_200165 [Neoconidiobolus thromboides FSU 785]
MKKNKNFSKTQVKIQQQQKNATKPISRPDNDSELDDTKEELSPLGTNNLVEEMESVEDKDIKKTIENNNNLHSVLTSITKKGQVEEIVLTDFYNGIRQLNEAYLTHIDNLLNETMLLDLTPSFELYQTALLNHVQYFTSSYFENNKFFSEEGKEEVGVLGRLNLTKNIKNVEFGDIKPVKFKLRDQPLTPETNNDLPFPRIQTPHNRMNKKNLVTSSNISYSTYPKKQFHHLLDSKQKLNIPFNSILKENNKFSTALEDIPDSFKWQEKGRNDFFIDNSNQLNHRFGKHREEEWKDLDTNDMDKKVEFETYKSKKLNVKKR